MLQKIKVYLKNVPAVSKIYYCLQEVRLHFFPQSAIKKVYKAVLGTTPDFQNPQTINEKLQVLKIGAYYNNSFVSDCIDKYKVKELLQSHFKIDGLKYANLYAAFDTVEELLAHGFDDYPEKFVIKCNHGCGYNYLCEDKNKIDIADIRLVVGKWMQEDYWKRFAEYQYRFIKKKIFVEQFLPIKVDGTYKIYCFNGIPKFLYVSGADEQGNADVYLDFYDMDFNHLLVSLCGHKHSLKPIVKPHNFNKIVEIAKCLSQKFPFVRIDLYVIDDEIYFSEFTFFPTGGYMHLSPPDVAYEWGKYLNLNNTIHDSVYEV